MSKFFDLCEANDPSNDGNATHDLYDFLKSQGINVSIVRGGGLNALTKTLYIDTGTDTIPVKVISEEEDAEDPAYNVNQEVENLASTAASGLKGLAAKGIGTTAQKAKSSVAKRNKLAGKAVNLYDKRTKDLEQSIRNSSKPPVTGSKISY